MILPHCTWDKFGEILANNGGRIYGLFDELVSFFSTMNMYSSSKGQVQDNREYQDFLKMFTGKAKTRETGTCLSQSLQLFAETSVYVKHLCGCEKGCSVEKMKT